MWLALVAVLFADALDLVDGTVTSVAAPTIMRDIGGGESLVKWLGAGYSVALGSLMVVGGRLGDRYGQRQTFLLGMAGFVAASVLAGCAPNASALITARVVQGAFGALLIPQGMAIMAAAFPRDMLKRAFAIFAPALVIFAAGGPVFGGLLLDADLLGLSWRAVFLINVVVGGAGFLLAWRVLPRVAATRETRIDTTGALLMIVAAFGVLAGVVHGTNDGWTELPLSLIGGGAVCFALFVRQQRAVAHPLLDRSLLANRGFSTGLIAGLLIFAIFSGVMYVLSLNFQLSLHFSPTQAAINLLPLTIGIAMGSTLSTALLSRLGRWVVALGLTASGAGLGTLLAVVVRYDGNPTSWQLGVATLIIGLGAGTCFNAIFNVTLGDVAPGDAGAASGSLNAIQQLANGIGTAVVTSVYFAAAASGPVCAMRVTLWLALVVTAACLVVAVPLLPRHSTTPEEPKRT